MSWNRLTAAGKAVVAIAVAGVALGGLYAAKNAIPQLNRTSVVSSVPDQVRPITGPAISPALTAAETVREAQSTATAATPVTLSIPVSGGSFCQVELWTIPWNATMGIHYANGGVTTAKDSLMDKAGVRLKLAVQDDYGKMQEAQLKFAEGVKAGQTCPKGAAFTVIMGDGYAAYAAGLDEPMKKLDQRFEVIGALGYSNGEDKCMLPREVAADPQKAKGSVVAGVMRDGDYNICVTWAAQNGIAINPDEKTWDADAMNFYSTSSFNDADNALIAGTCESRPEVKGGKPTGRTVKACVNGTATWTPGDVNVARNKGGMVAVASTEQYSYQMPSIIIGNHDFMAKNPGIAKGLLQAALAGSEAVRSSEKALDIGAKVSADVYGQEDAAYWKRYYKGVTEKDKLGYPVKLGGSRSIGFNDNAFLFGLNGNDNLYRRIYKQFGDHNAKYYPSLTPTYPAYETVVNTTYLQSVLDGVKHEVALPAAEQPKYDATAPIARVVAKRAWSISFDTGKATFKPDAIPVLEDMLNQIAITTLQVQINGHTDSVGAQDANIALSKARAEAVKNYLMTNASSGFPAERIRTRGFGDAMPVADNKSEPGRAQNRRVEVILGTTGE